MRVLFRGCALELDGFWHPGEPADLAQHEGQDITELFLSTGHSDCAKEMLIGLAADPASRQRLTQLPELQPDPLQVRIDQKLDFSQPLVEQVKQLSR